MAAPKYVRLNLETFVQSRWRNWDLHIHLRCWIKNASVYSECFVWIFAVGNQSSWFNRSSSFGYFGAKQWVERPEEHKIFFSLRKITQPPPCCRRCFLVVPCGRRDIYDMHLPVRRQGCCRGCPWSMRVLDRCHGQVVVCGAGLAGTE